MFRNCRGMAREDGMALILILCVLSVLLAMALCFVFTTRLEKRAAANYRDYVSAGLTLRAGLEHAFAVILDSRGSGPDSFHSRWRVDFSGEDYDNSGDGSPDSVWFSVRDESDDVTGWYAVLVQDESAKLNLNTSGNLSDDGGQGQNEGWSTFEISVERALSGLGFSSAAEEAGKLIRYRYGGASSAGGEGFDGTIPGGCSGVDTDGDGSPGSTDPLRFTPWKPAAVHGHNPLVELTQARLLGGEWKRRWERLRNSATVYSRTLNEYPGPDGSEPRLNLNAFDSPMEFYAAVSGVEGISGEDVSQYAVNVLDYRDGNDWISGFVHPDSGKTYYGVESVLINEVLSRSREVDTSLTGNSTGEVVGITYGGLAPDTAYRVSISIYRVSSPADVMVKVAEGEWEPAELYGPHDYRDISGARSDSAGDITIYTRFTKTKEFPYDEDAPVTGELIIPRVEFVAAEFIELLNIGADIVETDGWTVKISPGPSEPIPSGGIAPGEYLVLTNDIDLFAASYPGADLNRVANIDGWEGGYRTEGALPDDGEADIFIYVDEQAGLKADLAAGGAGGMSPNVSRPGNPSRVGVSREKNDPAVRNLWMDNASLRASPGGHNSVVSPEGVYALDGLRGGTYPPMVKNGWFASTGELTLTHDWREGGTGRIRYPGVRSSLSPWAPVPLEAAAAAAERITAGYCMRFDRTTAGAEGSLLSWEARLEKNSGKSVYRVYAYGEYPSAPVSVRAGDTDFGIFSLNPSGGAYIGEMDSGLFGADGALEVEMSDEIDYLILVPDSVHGRVNINTASAEVIMSLPGMEGQDVPGIIRRREISPFGGVGELVTEGIICGAAFAPVSNLASVNSETFRLVCTARTPAPGDRENPDVFSAEKRVEVLVDSAGGRLDIVSWKEMKN